MGLQDLLTSLSGNLSGSNQYATFPSSNNNTPDDTSYAVPSATPALPSVPQQQPTPAQPQQQAQAGQQVSGQQLSGIRGYLSNIFYNMGEAAKAHLGMPTDAQLQQNQQKINIEQQRANTDEDIRNRQLQLQTQIVTLPNGMQVPWALAKPYLDSQAKITSANIGAQAKITGTLIGKRFIPVPGVGMFDTQPKEGGDPQLVPGSSPVSVTVTDDIAKEYGIPDQLKGKAIPIQQFSSLLRGQAQFTPSVTNTTKTIEATINGQPTLVQVPQTSVSQRVPVGSNTSQPSQAAPVQSAAPNNSNAPALPAPANQTQGNQTPANRPPVSMSTKGGVRVLVGPDGMPLLGKSGSQMVYALDPVSNLEVATTRADAAAKGYQVTANNVGAVQIRKDQALSNRLSDVQRKVGDYASTFSQPIDDQDKMAISYLMDNNIGVGVHGISLLPSYVQSQLKARGMQALSDNGMRRFIQYNQARESLSGYQQILTNSSRSSDKVLELQLEQLPPPIADSDFANMATGEFQKNIDLAGQHIPIFPGSAETQQTIKQQQNKSNAQAAAIQANQQRGINQQAAPNNTQPQQTQPQAGQVRPSNVPSNYIYKVNGPKGTGWYNPNAAAK